MLFSFSGSIRATVFLLATVGIFGISFAEDTDPIKTGEMLYLQNCVFCHQADAIGKTGFAPSLTNPELLSISSDKFLLGTIRDGRPGTSMIPYAHLGRNKIKAIVAYLRSHETLPNRSAEVDAQPLAKGDVENGHQIFNQVCSTCHGIQGDGYFAGGSGTAIGNPSFLSKATDGFIRETVRVGRSGTRMLPFQGPEGLSNMTDEEVDDVITYMRTLNET